MNGNSAFHRGPLCVCACVWHTHKHLHVSRPLLMSQDLYTWLSTVRFSSLFHFSIIILLCNSSGARSGASRSTNRSGVLRLRQVESSFKAHPGTIWSCVLCPNTSRQTAALLCCPTLIFPRIFPRLHYSGTLNKIHTRIWSSYDCFFFWSKCFCHTWR